MAADENNGNESKRIDMSGAVFTVNNILHHECMILYIHYGSCYHDISPKSNLRLKVHICRKTEN